MKTINLTNESALLENGDLTENRIEIRHNAKGIIKKFSAGFGVMSATGKIWLIVNSDRLDLRYRDPETGSLHWFHDLVAEHGTLELIMA